MARTKGAKGKGKVKFSKFRLRQAMDYKKSSLRKLGKNNEIEASDKTLRNYMKAEEMPEKILDEICRVLDVYIGFIKGDYDKNISNMSKEAKKIHLMTYTPKNFPYNTQKGLEYQNGLCIENILSGHGISMDQYYKLNEYKRMCFERDLEKGIADSLYKHFDKLANGNDIIEVFALWNQIDYYIDEEYDDAGNRLPKIQSIT